jgi:hypothetical protein
MRSGTPAFTGRTGRIDRKMSLARAYINQSRPLYTNRCRASRGSYDAIKGQLGS